MSPPSIPLIFVRPLVEASQITFTWLPPSSDGGSSITGYILSCASPSFTRYLQSYDRSTLVTDLTPGVSYTFTLVAVNADGTSEPATFRTVTTGYRPGTTSNIQAYLGGTNTAIVTWSTATEIGQSPLLNYVVRGDAYNIYDTLYNNSTILKTASNISYFLPISSIGPYKYRFYSIPVNDVGYGAIGMFSTINNIPPPSPISSFSINSVMGFSSTISGTYYGGYTQSPILTSSLSIGALTLTNYEYCVKSTTTITSFTNSDWFTTEQDTTASFCVINGDLTIDSGVTFTPTNRKLFTTLFVTGNLTLNGQISMTGKGAKATPNASVVIATGTYSGVPSPMVPLMGGNGGVGVNDPTGRTNGTAGMNGFMGGTGGGGSGGPDFPTNPPYLGYLGGNGSSGTCFSGGSGGGGGGWNGVIGSAGSSATANGGQGGNSSPFNTSSAGGAGNPGGTNPSNVTNMTGSTGIGGVLFVFCLGSVSGSGSITADGVQNTTPITPNIPGGSSGGGHISLFYSTTNSITTLTANGGSSQVGNFYNGTVRTGGAGGNGTARALQIP